MTAETDNLQPAPPAQRGRRATFEGIVVSNNRQKTIKVVTERLVKDPRYGKYRRRRTYLHAHDEKNQAQVGDLVEVMETRPISKTKCWRLVRIIRTANLPQDVVAPAADAAGSGS